MWAGPCWPPCRAAVLEWSVSYQTISQAASMSSPAAVAAILAVSSIKWVLMIDLWNCVVALFYLPVYQCTELGYFDIAKETSGIGLGASPRNESPDRAGRTVSPTSSLQSGGRF